MRKRLGIILMVIWLTVLILGLAWLRHRAEAEVIGMDEVTLGDYVAMRTADGWECRQLENHLGALVWMKRPEIEVGVHD